MIEVAGLTKRYGRLTAVDDVSFQVKPGEIVGLLGPNGAGKTTTIRILAGFLTASAGAVRVAGQDLGLAPAAARRSLGYLPEGTPLPGDLSVLRFLRQRANFFGVGQRAIDAAMDACAIADRAGTRIDRLSKGLRQRVGLAQAILHDPPVLILDEPTSGLDPAQIVEVRALTRRLGHDRAVLFSSHQLSEVSATCDRALVIDKGRLVAEQDLQATAGNAATLVLEVEGPADAVAACLAETSGTPPTVRDPADARNEVRAYHLALASDDPAHLHALAPRLAETVIGQGWRLHALYCEQPGLESTYLRLTGAGRPEWGTGAS